MFLLIVGCGLIVVGVGVVVIGALHHILPQLCKRPVSAQRAKQRPCIDFKAPHADFRAYMKTEYGATDAELEMALNGWNHSHGTIEQRYDDGRGWEYDESWAMVDDFIEF